MSATASLGTTNRMQQWFNVLTNIYNVFLLLFHSCILLEVKLTTTTTTTGSSSSSSSSSSSTIITTAGHLSEITIPVRPLCLTAGAFSTEAHWHYMRDLPRPSGKVYGRPSLLHNPDQQFPWEGFSPNMPQRQCVVFVLIEFSIVLTLYANYYLKPKRKSYKSKSGL